jgi:hypothetical protein
VADVIREKKAETPDSHGLLAQLTKRIMTSSPRPKGRWTRIWATPSMTRSAATAAIRATARAKTVLIDIGPVQVAIPRDREGTFEPQIVRKRQRQLSGLDGLVISLSAKGLTHGEICAHLAEVYGATVSNYLVTVYDGVVTGEVVEERLGCRQIVDGQSPPIARRLHRRPRRRP